MLKCFLFVFTQGTGIQLGNIVLAATSVLMALAICFYSSWELSLVMVLAFPLLFISYRLANSLYYSTGSGDGDSLQVSSHIVLETVRFIKTVFSLGAEEYFVKSVQHFLRVHTKYIHQIYMHNYTACISYYNNYAWRFIHCMHELNITMYEQY